MFNKLHICCIFLVLDLLCIKFSNWSSTLPSQQLCAHFGLFHLISWVSFRFHYSLAGLFSSSLSWNSPKVSFPLICNSLMNFPIKTYYDGGNLFVAASSSATEGYVILVRPLHLYHCNVEEVYSRIDQGITLAFLCATWESSTAFICPYPCASTMWQ